MDPRTNFGYSVVTVAPSPASSGTTLTVQDGSQLPTADFNLVIWPSGQIPLASNAEIVRVTSRAGDVLTIQRQQEGSSARAIQVGDQVGLNITAKFADDVETELASKLTNVKLSAGAASELRSDFTFNNGNGVSFGLTNGVFTATVRTDYQSAGAYLTTAALSQDSSKYAGINGAITGGSITVNTSGVSVNLPAYLTNIKVSAGANSALRSDITFSNSNGVSFGLETNGVITGTVATNYQSQGNYLTTAMASNRGSDFVQATAAFHGTNASGTIASNDLSISVAAQSVQTQNVIAASLSGNTSGVLALVSSGTLILAGGNNITVSQNGQSVTISGPNAGGAQTGISGVVVSDATYTSGTISFSNAGNITISSSVNGATQFVRLSGHAAQTTQSAIKAFGVSNTGQTAGNTGVSTGIDWVLAGSQSITLSQSTAAGGPNTVWVQHPAWLTTAMLSNAATISNINVSGGTTSSNLSALKFIDSQGVSWSLDTGSKIYATVKTDYLTSQSTQFLALTLGGNTVGTTTFHASNNASLFLNGGNNITLSGNGSTVTISAANQTNQSAIKGFGASNTGNTAGNTGLSTGIDWVLAGSNNVTISQSTTAGGPNTLWVSGPTVGGAQTGISGIVVSDATYTSGTVSFSNAGNVTISSSVNGATQYIRLSVAAQSNQTVGLYASSNTYLTSSGTVDARSLSFRGDKSITIGVSAGEVLFSVGAYLTTAMASNRGSDFVQATAGFNGTNASGTIASNSISVSVAAPIPIGTNVKAVASVGSTGTITRYAPEDHQHAGVAAFAVTNTGNTLGNTRSQVGTFYVAASGAITASQSTGAAGNDTVWLSVAAQTNQTLGLYMSSNTTSSVSSGTVDARSLTFRGMGVASVGYSGGEVVVSVPAGGGGLTNINISAGTTSNNLSNVTFADSNGVSWGLNASTVTASVATYSTVGTATTGYSVDSANSVGTVARWAAEDHKHAGIGAIGISTAGNSAGTTGSQLGTYWLQGGNAITVSQITSNNGSHTAIISGPSHATLSQYYNLGRIGDAASTFVTCGGSVLQVVPFMLQAAVSGLFMRVPASLSHVSSEFSGTTANTTWTVNRGYTQGVAILTQNVGASSLSLAYSTSTQATWNFQNVIGAGAQGSRYTVTQNVSYPVSGTTSNYTTSYAQSSANVQLSAASMTLFTGPRFVDVPFGISLSAGHYWAVFGMSTSSGTTGGGNAAAGNVSVGFSTVAVTNNTLVYGYPGAVTNSSIQNLPGLGSWSTNSAVLSSSSLQLASISIQANNPHIGFGIHRFA